MPAPMMMISGEVAVWDFSCGGSARKEERSEGDVRR